MWRCVLYQIAALLATAALEQPPGSMSTETRF